MAVTFTLIRTILSVHVDIDIFNTAIYPASESFIKTIHIHLKNILKHFAVWTNLRILMNQRQQLLKAKLLRNVLHHQIGLEISKTQISIAVCSGKAGVKISYRQQPVLLHRAHQFQPLTTTPFWSRLTLFPGRNTLREPAWHTVMGHLQSEHMNQFMPYYFLPVGTQGIR